MCFCVLTLPKRLLFNYLHYFYSWYVTVILLTILFSENLLKSNNDFLLPFLFLFDVPFPLSHFEVVTLEVNQSCAEAFYTIKSNWFYAVWVNTIAVNVTAASGLPSGLPTPVLPTRSRMAAPPSTEGKMFFMLNLTPIVFSGHSILSCMPGNIDPLLF